MSIGLTAFCRFWGKTKQYHIVQTDAGEISIPKFDGRNYKDWAFKIKMALKALGAWRIVTGEFKHPGKNAPSEKLEAFHIINGKGCACIYFSLEQEVLDIVEDLDITTGCKTAWNLLEFTFSDAGLESMLPQDTLEDICAVNDFRDADIVNWIERRRKTIETVEFWYNGLKWISSGAQCTEVVSLVASICGNVMELFFPEVTFLGMNSKNLITGGRCGNLAMNVLEGLGAEISLLKVRAVLKEDTEKSAPLGELFERIARIEERLRYDFDVSLRQYLCFWLKCKANQTFAVQGTINFKGMKLDIEGLQKFTYGSLKIVKKFGLIRSVGERLGIGGKKVKKVLGAAELCLDMIDLYDKLFQHDPEYLKIVETRLESLKKELEDVEKGYQPHRGENDD